MITVNIDQAQIMQLARQKIEEIVKQVDAEMVFWDAAELRKRTCMSWNFIQEHFFFDPRFPKRKIGSKWFFPAREARAFLETWLTEQPK